VSAPDDIWSRWLLNRRTGGDLEMRRRVLEGLRPIRDRVIEGARISPSATVLDVGCGDGMIGFAVLDQYPEARVIFCDISPALVEACEAIARETGLRQRSDFVVADAQDLSAIPSESVDAVVLRSVLIYVPDKAAAHREFFRVLRPRGRLSYFEPINAIDRADRPDGFFGYDVGPVAHLAEKVSAVFSALQPSGDPMINFKERDLAAFAEDAGFDPVHLSVEIAYSHSIPEEHRLTWEQWLAQSGNPKIPSVGEALDQALTSAERDDFTAWMRPQVVSGRGIFRIGRAFVTATRPG
jgi:ubiquinone/menaquinone biosynthesis C-methylase UbiE